jgi:hypothetical protein
MSLTTLVLVKYVTIFTGSDIPALLDLMVRIGATTFFFGLIYQIGLLAYERYAYFCIPLTYHTMFSTKKLIVIFFVLYAFWFCCAVLSEIYFGREFRSSTLLHSLKISAMLSVVQVLVILLPTSSMTIFCAVKIGKVIRNGQLAPALPQGVQGPVPIGQARRALRMILLISGAFWGATIPGYIVMSTLIAMGFTWEDLDSRRYLIPFVMARVSGFGYVLLPSFVNPFIYYYTRKDLRQA